MFVGGLRVTEGKLGDENMIYCYLKHLTKQAYRYFIKVKTAILPIRSQIL